MKAARFSRFGGPEVLEIVDLPEPHPVAIKYGSPCERQASMPATGRSARARDRSGARKTRAVGGLIWHQPTCMAGFSVR